MRDLSNDINKGTFLYNIHACKNILRLTIRISNGKGKL